MPCKECEENPGYMWDSMLPCPCCAEGKRVQYNQNKAKLKSMELMCRELRKQIKQYELEIGL